MAVTINGTTGITTPDIDSVDATFTGTVVGDNSVPDAIDVNASAPADSLAIDANGRVGIGTTSPDSQLVIDRSGDTLKLNLDSDSIDVFANGKTFNVGTTGDTVMRFFTNNAEAARIESSGNFKFNSGYGSAATAYGCRAWIQFGMDSGGISGSGGVSSITDIGTGHFRVNLSFTAPDTGYSVQVSDNYGQAFTETYTTTNFRVKAYNANYALRDSTLYMAAMFR